MPPKGSAPAAARRPQQKLSQNAIRLYESALSLESKTLSNDEILAMFEDVPEKQIMEDINTLLGKGLLVVLKDKRGAFSYQAVSKADAKETANLDTETKVVYDIIKSSGNLGVWLKTLKQRANLHGQIVNRCIKTLENQKKIKEVRGVKHPTRRIFILFGTTPSTELTGGPFYGEKDLDDEFIDALLTLTRNFLTNETVPTSSYTTDPVLFPSAHTPLLPTAEDVLDFIKATKVFQSVELSVENMETLLQVLIYDGFCEKIFVRKPGFDGNDDDEEEDEEDPDYNFSLKEEEHDVHEPPSKRSRTTSKLFKDEDEDSGEEAVPDEEEDGHNMDFDLPPSLNHQKQNSDKKKAQSSLASKVDRFNRRPKKYHVYRCIPNANTAYNLKIGLTDAPCGLCPVHHLCENRGNPVVLDAPPVAVECGGGGGGSSTVPAKTALNIINSSSDNIEEWLKMKVPGGSDLSHAGDRVWKGGAQARRDADVPAPVNATNCKYFNEWLSW